MTTEHRFTVVLDPLDEGGFNVLVPGLPEVTTFGETEEEALAMAGDAVRLAISYRLDHGEETRKVTLRRTASLSTHTTQEGASDEFA